MEDLRTDFRRDYLVRLPLPLAQLYSRAHNAKSPRERHDNAFYLFEAAAKLLAITSAAWYLDEVTRINLARVPALDRMLAQLVLPSLGQWVGMLRELTRYFGERVDSDTHPWGGISQRLGVQRKDLPAILALYQRIKHGADGKQAGDQSCSLLGVLEALVQYRNGVFGHGAGRFESFYAEEMGPLLFPAINELFSDPALDPLGPKGARLVYITEVRVLENGGRQIGLRDLVGTQSERMAPLELSAEQSEAVLPNRVAMIWPGRLVPLRLDPLLRYLETDLSEEVLFLNRDRNGRHVEYLSYTTGRTERDRSMMPDLAELLSRVTNNTVREEDLRRLSEQTFSETPSVEMLFTRGVEAAQEGGEYDLIAEIGRGGMGVVYLARQKSLGRLVALKMLPSDLAGDEVALARFKREIRHLARCDDPHIVKILANGTLPDGRIYYTMEYVQGSDLEMVWRELAGEVATSSTTSLGNTTWAKAVLTASRKQRSKAEAASRSARDASSDSRDTPVSHVLPLPALPELPSAADDPGGYIRRVVMLIRDVAVALQTIHDQGIVHRDVKPANLMLTPDGTRIVLMDFGLAKGETHALTASQQGGLLGTLRYAAPEQLAAANFKIGPAADVRALGVTLWELLTRQRLFGSANDEARLAQEVLTADVPRLRTIDPRFDRDLEAVVARATERRIADRISTAGKLADLLQLWLDGKPLPIRPPGSGEIAVRWIREHRGVVATASVALLAIIAALVTSFFTISAAKDRAELALALAKRQGELAMESLTSLVFDIDNQLLTRPGMNETRRRILQKASEGLSKIAEDLGDDVRVDHGQMEVHLKLGRLFMQIGDAEDLGGLEKAETQFLRARQFAGRVLQSDPKNLVAQRYDSLALNDLGNVRLLTGRVNEALETLEESRDLAEALTQQNPELSHLRRDLSVVYYRLGSTYLQAGNIDKARDYMAKDLAIAEELATSIESDTQAAADLAESYQSLGRLNLQAGSLTQAMECFTKGLGVSLKVANADPSNSARQASVAYAHNWLGHANLATGDLDASRKHFDESTRILESVVELDPDNTSMRYELSKSLGSLADLFRTTGEIAKAREYYERGRQINQEVLEENSEDVDVRSSLASTVRALGSVCEQTGDVVGAKGYYEQAIELMESIVARDASNASARGNLANTYRTLGSLLMNAADLETARSYFDKDLAITSALAASDPRNASKQQNLAFAHNWLGHVFMQMGLLTESRDHFASCNAILKTLAAADSADSGVQLELAKSYGALGDIEVASERYEEALVPLEENRQIVQRLIQQNPKNMDLQSNLGWLECEFGTIFMKTGKPDAARTSINKAIASFEMILSPSPEDADAQAGLANSLRWLGQIALEKGDFAEARQSLTRDLEITLRLANANPGNARAQSDLSHSYFWLGRLAHQDGRLNEAHEFLSKGLTIARSLMTADPQNANARSEVVADLEADAAVLESRKDLAAAIALRSELVDLRPELATPWNLRGNVYFLQSNWEAAIQDYSKAIELLPTDSVLWRNRSITYLNAGDFAKAKNDIEKALRIKPEESTYQNLLQQIEEAMAK